MNTPGGRGRKSRNDHFLRSAFQVSGSLILLNEYSWREEEEEEVEEEEEEEKEEEEEEGRGGTGGGE